MIPALELFLSQFDLEPDIWMLYITMPCPDPDLHRLTGYCPDCLNKDIELEDKDIPTLSAVRRLANACKALNAHLKIYSKRNDQDAKEGTEIFARWH